MIRRRAVAWGAARAAAVVAAVLIGGASGAEDRAVAGSGSAGSAPAREAARARVLAVFTDLKSDRGRLRVSLFLAARGFPTDSEFACRRLVVPIRDREARVSFDDLEPGRYAVSAFHDEDDDGKLREGLLGMPAEGIAMSNDARGRFGPPKFEEATFDAAAGATEVRMKIRY